MHTLPTEIDQPRNILHDMSKDCTELAISLFLCLAALIIWKGDEERESKSGFTDSLNDPSVSVCGLT